MNSKPHFRNVIGLCLVLAAHAVSSAQSSPPSRPETAQPLKPCGRKNPPPCIDKPLAVMNSPAPEYSVAARNEKIEGTVVLYAVVGTDGFAHGVQVARSLDYGLDESAVAAVKRWTFRPASSRGNPVPVKVKIELQFRYSSRSLANWSVEMMEP
jgi:TonB family protein